MTVLPDTSVWVRYLRHGRTGEAAALEQLLVQRDVVTCGPVVAELLVGTRPDRRQELAALIDAVPWVEFGRAEWRRSGYVAAALREQGATVALTDVEIAVAAEAAGAALWTFDSDFERVAQLVPMLRLFQPGSA
ncbi:MAG TPA: PIN domain-containing protein [Chloroflexota bacterium]